MKVWLSRIESKNAVWVCDGDLMIGINVLGEVFVEADELWKSHLTRNLDGCVSRGEWEVL